MIELAENMMMVLFRAWIRLIDPFGLLPDITLFEDDA